MKTASQSGVSKGIRILQIIVGIIAIALSIAVIAFPIFAIGFLLTLLALGLLFIGVARIVHGIFNKQTSKWSRIFLVAVGILSIAIAFMVFINPLLGIFILV